MVEQFDFVIIGAGLSGLIQGCIYAQNGFKVCILEKQRIPGGYLQTFTRKKFRFDTGFHYIGSTKPHKPLRRFLDYLDVFSELPIYYYPDECFFEIVSGANKFCVPSSFKSFIQKLKDDFPGEEIALERFEELITSITSSFRWYDLQENKVYERYQNLPTHALSTWLRQNIGSEWLKDILGSFSFNIGLRPDEIPIVQYAICLDSIFDHPIWLYDGGDGLVHPLLKRLEELDVTLHLSTSVIKLHAEQRKITKVETDQGQLFQSKYVISTIHPKLVMDMIDDTALRPFFKKNILEMKDSRGSFGLNIILKEELSIKPLNYIYVPENLEHGLYDGIYFNSPSLLNNKIKKEQPLRPRLNVCVFVNAKPFLKYRESKFGKRPKEYNDLKEEYADIILNDLQKFIPDLKEKIDFLYTSSPLTNEHYTGSVDGSSFGISHDIYQQTIHRPAPRTRVKNLFFSGQSINMPGICGVIVNAFSTAGLILGEDNLFNKVMQKTR